MATHYIKGNAVANATSYELVEKAGGNLIDIANPTAAPTCWSYDSNTQVWTMTNSEYANLRWDVEVPENTTVTFSFTVANFTGGGNATIRESSGTTLKTLNLPDGDSGDKSISYTTTTSGTYSFRVCGFSTNSGEFSNFSVVLDGDIPVYTTLMTASSIDFDLSTISFTTGSHVLAVKASADGYEDSDYSNEVTYTV